MTWFSNLKVANKLACGSGLSFALVAMVGVVAIGRMGVMDAKAGMSVTDSLSGVAALAKISADVRMFRLWVLRHAVTRERAGKARIDEDCRPFWRASIRDSTSTLRRLMPWTAATSKR